MVVVIISTGATAISINLVEVNGIAVDELKSLVRGQRGVIVFFTSVPSPDLELKDGWKKLMYKQEAGTELTRTSARIQS